MAIIRVPCFQSQGNFFFFYTLLGLYQLVIILPVLFWALPMYWQLVDQILFSHWAYATTYLDNIIIYSNEWQQHLQYTWEVLKSLRWPLHESVKEGGK